MFQSFLKLLRGNPNQQILNGIQPIVEKVNAFEENISKLSDTELQAKTDEFKIKNNC